MILFREKQKFKQWWILTVVLALAGVTVYEKYTRAMKASFENNPEEIKTLIFVSLVTLIIVGLILFVFLETEIGENGVGYKFFPIHFKRKFIPWSDIEKAFVRKYNPILEYGGWGFRLGLLGKGRALNISGNKGLQLILKNGKRLLIGTKKPEEIEMLLLELKKKNILNT